MTPRRVLICGQRVPEFDRESGSRRLFDIIRYFKQAGWHVTFVAKDPSNGERYIRMLQQLGVAIYGGDTFPIEQLLTPGRFDLAILAFWHIAERWLPIIRKVSPTTRVVVDSIDLHFLRTARRISQAGAPGYGMLDGGFASEMIQEINTYVAADAVLVVSDKEASFLRDLQGSNVSVFTVPDAEDAGRSPIPFAARKGILFIGNFWHQPNVEAAEFLCRRIVPWIGRAKLAEHPVMIVGHAMDDRIKRYGLDLPNVRMVGWVPSVFPYLERARVTVVPVLHGAGTKRKLVQALMVGTPTVSTTVGIEGLGLQDGDHVLVADEGPAFAGHVAALLDDEELWSRLAERGHAHIAPLHDPKMVAARLMTAVEAVLAAAPKPPELAEQLERLHAQVPLLGRFAQPVREAIRRAVPIDATVLVVSKGDDELLNLDGRRGWHFPQADGGAYAGYHPPDSAAAIAHLEALRGRGASFILLPRPAFWWLDHYVDFKNHLDNRYRRVSLAHDSCILFDLRPRGPAPEVQTAAPDVRTAAPEGTLAASPVPPTAVSTPPAVLDAGMMERLRPSMLGSPPRQKRITRNTRPKVLVVGIYLAGELNTVSDIVPILGETARYDVTQHWIALSGDAPTPEVSAVTVRHVNEMTPKFALLNELLIDANVEQYEYVLLTDDDVVFPRGFTDRFFSLQSSLGFVLAQPARTANSYIDHPIVEQQLGVLARQTMFVEIGPVVAWHRSVHQLLYPFDLSSSMGWGYENVWSYLFAQRKLKMGIIDAVPVDHSVRPVTKHYTWDAADKGRTMYLQQREHLSIEQCARVLDVVPIEEAN